MARYHISPTTGNPGQCRAEQGNCPFGSSDEHYASAEAARQAYEASMEDFDQFLKDFSAPSPWTVDEAADIEEKGTLAEKLAFLNHSRTPIIYPSIVGRMADDKEPEVRALIARQNEELDEWIKENPDFP